MSIYFRDLNNGPWFGIREDDSFTPGSLLKVPLMIAYLKELRSNPQLFEKTLIFEDSMDANTLEYFTSSQSIQRGKAYPVSELVARTIVYSDNNAATLLLRELDREKLLQTYEELGIIIPGYRTIEESMPLKRYATLFRMLYNASYLDRDFSEKALELLSKTEFKRGIVASVPTEIPVAHKFGERSLAGQNGPHQLHDCGIVYYPGHPYLLCIMTQGEDLDTLAGVIEDAAKLVYGEVDRQAVALR